MQMNEILTRTDGLQWIARELGINETQAANGAAALVPMILGGFKRELQTEPAGGLGLLGLIGQLGGSALLDDVLGPTPADVSHGNKVLERIFGSKDVSRAVARKAAAQTGLSPATLKKMLPMLATLVTGHMAMHQVEHAAHHVAAGSPLSEVLGTLGSRIAAGGNPIPDVAPGLIAMLDLDGAGNPLDDVLEMAGRAMR